LYPTWGKEWMHSSLNAVEISNTWYNTGLSFLISDFNIIYFLTNRTCVRRNGFRDFSITLDIYIYIYIYIFISLKMNKQFHCFSTVYFEKYSRKERAFSIISSLWSRLRY
jgi:hypothetical protein